MSKGSLQLPLLGPQEDLATLLGAFRLDPSASEPSFHVELIQVCSMIDISGQTGYRALAMGEWESVYDFHA